MVFVVENETDKAYLGLNIAMSVVATICTLITIRLIHWMKVERGGHLLLVLTMSYYQLFYDISFPFSTIELGHYIVAAAAFFQLLCGIGGSVASNWIAFTAWYIITYAEKPDIAGRFHLIVLSTLVVSLPDALLYFFSVVPQEATNENLEDISIIDYYYYARLASIGVNFVFCIITIYKINLMSSKKAEKSAHERAIETLVQRIIYYPIVQSLSRSGLAWYEEVYGINFSPHEATPTQYACIIFFTIVTPLASVGYLVIFLIMQPSAYTLLKSKLGFQVQHVDDGDFAGRSSESAGTEEIPSEVLEHPSLSLAGSIIKPVRPSLFDWNRPSSFVGELYNSSATGKTEEMFGEHQGTTCNPVVTETHSPFRSSVSTMELTQKDKREDGAKIDRV